MTVQFQSPADKWVKCISTSGTIRAIAITAIDSVRFLSERHRLSPIGTKALGESMVAGLLLSSYCKSGEKVNLNIKGSGWIQQSIVDANSDAEIRGYVFEREPEKIQIAKDIGPWGIGLLSVLRTKFDEAQPYVGTVPLLTGHLAKDLTFYWLQSEQVQSAVGIDVRVTPENKIEMAEGFLIQAMPGADEKDITFIEDHLKNLNHFDVNSSQRKTPINLLSYLLENQSFSVIEEKPVQVKCTCSIERVKKSLTLIGQDELQSMLNEKKNFDITCDFCGELYTLEPKDLLSIITGD